jgi:Phosphotransferase enzyme family
MCETTIPPFIDQARLQAVRELPLFRRGWPEDLAVRALRLFQERHGLLDLLDRLPQTVRHGDADRRNLLARNRDSTSESIAIDWAYTGTGPVGEEIAPLVVSSVMWFMGVSAADLGDLDATVFDAYIEGLRDSGWDGDPRLVRLACTATMALRYGPLSGVVGLVSMAAEQRANAERMLGRTAEEFLDQYAEVQRFALDRADEARRLTQPV